MSDYLCERCEKVDVLEEGSRFDPPSMVLAGIDEMRAEGLKLLCLDCQRAAPEPGTYAYRVAAEKAGQMRLE